MKERPILFSGPMVRAILDGRKWQTRRVVRQPKKWTGVYDVLRAHMFEGPEVWWWDGEHKHVGASQECPYGVPGDRLWVRETWHPGFDGGPIYRATDGEPPEHCREGWKWRPSIYMPRWASRITLEVAEVRVERLQDITEWDAAAEGVEASQEVLTSGGQQCYTLPFQTLWRQINGIDNPASWEANPWVWVVEFRKL